MNFINKLTLQARLKLLICIPLLFLAIVLSMETYANFINLKKADVTGDMAEIAITAAKIAHELQEERAMTDSFLGSRGQKFQDKLPTQRQATDKQIKALKELLTRSGAVEHDRTLAGQLQKTLAGLNHIGSVRQLVDSPGVVAGEIFTSYAEIIRELRATLQLTSQVIPDQEVARLLAAHYNFLEFMMRLHGERLLMTNTFANNEFANLMFMRFAEGLAEQKVYLESFLTLANAEAREFYQRKMQASSVSQVAAFRNAAIERRFGGGFNINPENWASAVTNKIGVMGEIENHLMNSYTSVVELRKKEGQLAFLVKIGFGFMVIVLSVLASILVSSNLARTLRKITSEINEGSFQVSSAARQLAATSHTVADNSSRQAAALEETSASMEEMSAMIRRDAENASQADSLMKDANQILGQADGSMKKLTLSMAEINSASLQTQKIVKTIDEIAFQTNLLALNAAVEAARAGESGAGFAVVADEVRNLAQRAAEAARNTNGLIEGTVQKVRAGSVLVSETGESFDSARQGVEKIATLLTELASSSREEAEAVHQVNEAIRHIDSGTQENAASAEETASAAEELSGQASSIQTKVVDLLHLVGGTDDSGKTWQSRNSASDEEGYSPQHLASAGDRQAGKRFLALNNPATPSRPAKKNLSSENTAKKQNQAAVIPFNDEEFEDF